MESENEKFKVGDWIISNSDMQFNIIAEITSIRNSLYYIRNIYGNEGYETWDSLRDNYHVWTIQDAKAGDVLSDGTTIFIFKDLLSDGSVMSYCDYDANSGESDAFCPLPMNLTCSKITPATKEQRDTLLKAMAEVGYVFDFEKKELKKIEQKHGWSEEDKKNMGFLCELLTDLQVKSNENEIKHGTNSHSEYYHNIKKWLKDKVQSQPEQEWSEEDEEYLKHAIEDFQKLGDSYLTFWLKSLKDRYTWKPSDEQMEVLWKYAEQNNCDGSILTSLYNDLKKLKD